MQPLTSAQRKFLRAQAHHLEPLVLIGKQGVTDMVVRTVSDALEARELIKVKFNEFKDGKGPLIDEIEQRTGSQVAGVVGHVAIFYRWQPDDEKRKIELPKPRG